MARTICVLSGHHSRICDNVTPVAILINNFPSSASLIPSCVKISLHIFGFAPNKIKSAASAPLTFSRHSTDTEGEVNVCRRCRPDSSRLTQAMNLLGMRWVRLAMLTGVEVPLEDRREGKGPGCSMLSIMPETIATPIVPLPIRQTRIGFTILGRRECSLLLPLLK